MKQTHGSGCSQEDASSDSDSESFRKISSTDAEQTIPDSVTSIKNHHPFISATGPSSDNAVNDDSTKGFLVQIGRGIGKGVKKVVDAAKDGAAYIVTGRTYEHYDYLSLSYLFYRL